MAAGLSDAVGITEIAVVCLGALAGITGRTECLSAVLVRESTVMQLSLTIFISCCARISSGP